MAFLYEKLDAIREYGACAVLPAYIPENLNPNFELRPYQKQAFENFITHFESRKRPNPLQVLFHMATGSGKTLIMAGLMLYLYKQGYRNFLFFVNLSNIVEKTKENFCNSASTKYLFADEIVLDGEHIRVNHVDNFQYADKEALNISFATTQGLHLDMWFARENGMSLNDFDEQKVVLISDEAHHLNVDTRKKMSSDEVSSYRSWESTVKGIFERNAENVLLEFTATCDLENPEIRAAYENKMIFDYRLTKFYNDGYSKDILTHRSELTIMERALQALVLSQYRLKIFQSNRLNLKPVVLFKAARIADSKEFMAEFIESVRNLTGKTLHDLSLASGNDEVMSSAFAYFSRKGISLETLATEIRDDFSGEHCISVNDEQDATQKQILLNSLEEADNPYRAVFEVKKLDEGWDVLNLFDIVRLYETRQSGGGKVSPATISEAQLIGRGARYCPFRISGEQPKFQRKYDHDVTNELRVCETLYYHCQNDHRYVTELHNALREIGLDTDKIVQREYVLKEEFKATDLYRRGVIFLNDREVKDRKEVRALPASVRDELYHFRVDAGASGVDAVMSDSASVEAPIELKTAHFTIKEIASINYAVVNKVLMKYPIFKFNTLHSYFPNIASTRQFITDEEYLGAVHIEIQSRDERPTAKTLYAAVFYVLGRIAAALSGIEETYRGTKTFRERKIHDVFRNKTVNYTEPHDGGVGISQNDPSVRREWKMDLSTEDWFAYTDNYGTSEEKAFVAYFRGYVADLRKIYQRIHLVRNEREFHLYSFEDGSGLSRIMFFFFKGTRMMDSNRFRFSLSRKAPSLSKGMRGKKSFCFN